ncbi:MAG: BPSS1780 family membrane protein [Burkholderiales bacterium]
MTGTDSLAATESPAANFHAEGRVVAARRGWDWIVEAFALFRKRPGIWILAAVALGILFIAVGGIPYLGSMANALLFPILGAGLMLGCRTLDRSDTLEIAHVFAALKQNADKLATVAVCNLIAAIAITFAVDPVTDSMVMAVMQGGTPGAGISITSMLIALLVTGLLVPLYMAVWFAPALIVLNELAPVAALKASYFACARNWIPFLVYGVVLLLLGIVAAIPVGLGLLVLIPVLIASVYTAYRDIFCGGQD